MAFSLTLPGREKAMKYIAAMFAAASVLTACNGAPPNEKLLTQLCTDVFEGDARTAGMIAGETGTDLETFCGCFATQTVAGETKIDLHKEILQTMVTIRTENNFDVERTADRVEDQIESGEIDGFTSEQFDELGDVFQDLSMEIGRANGACPTS